MDVPKDSPRRIQEGLYASHKFDVPKVVIKVIILNTRYFRMALTPDLETKKTNQTQFLWRGTLLVNEQWQWLSDEFNASQADFNIIVSSIQVLSNEHGFET